MSQNAEGSEWQAWLDEVTQGLPLRTAQAVSRELSDHFQDGFEDYVNQGHLENAAADLALANLGPAGRLNRGLKDAHLGRGRYRRAMLLSALVMLVNFLVPMLVDLLPGPAMRQALAVGPAPAGPILASLAQNGERLLLILFDLILGLASIYVLRNFRSLLTWRFDLDAPARFFDLALAGLAFQMVFDLLNLALFGSSVNLGLAGVRAGAAGLEAALLLLTSLGFLALGAGLLGLAFHLGRWPGRLYGLKLPVAILLALMGLPMTTMWVWLFVAWEAAATLAAFLSVSAQLLLWPALILLFFRAAYRPPLPPARTA